MTCNRAILSWTIQLVNTSPTPHVLLDKVTCLCLHNCTLHVYTVKPLKPGHIIKAITHSIMHKNCHKRPVNDVTASCLAIIHVV